VAGASRDAAARDSTKLLLEIEYRLLPPKETIPEPQDAWPKIPAGRPETCRQCPMLSYCTAERP